MPKDAESRVEGALAHIVESYESLQAPLAEIDAMRIECEQCHTTAEHALASLRQALNACKSHSKLPECEYVAERLEKTPLMAKFKFDTDGVLRIDDHLLMMERKASKSISSTSMAQTVLYALLALILGVIVARYV